MSIRQADLDGIEATRKKAVAAYNDRDHDAFVNTYTEDCTFVAPGSAPLKGRAALKLASQGFVKSGATEAIHGEIEPRLMGEYIFETHQTQILDKDNKVVDTINCALIWRKDDDGVWRQMFEMVNSQNPPKPPSS